MAASVLVMYLTPPIPRRRRRFSLLHSSPRKSSLSRVDMFTLPGFLRRSSKRSRSLDAGSSTQLPPQDSKDNDHAQGSERRRTSTTPQEEVRNIYRRPSASMARAKPQEKFSIAEMKRKQFAQRSMWYSEPVRDELLDDPALGMDFDDEDEDYGDDDCFCKEEESVSRSRGCVERISTRSDSGIHTSRTSSSSSYCSNASNSSDKLNRKEPVPGSILKKNYSDCSVREPEESLNTTTNSSPPLTPCGLKKQTSFKEEVDIYRYDKRDVPASAASTSKDSQKLKDNSHLAVEGKLQVPEQHACEHTTTKEEDSTESSSKDDVTAGDPQCSAKDSPKEEKTPRRTSSGSGSGSMFRARKIELLTEIEGACDSMRLILCLSDGYVKSRTTVKALSGGYSLIVSSEQQRGAQENHDGDKDEANYSEERINLPLKVDPYSVKAFMHTSGSLIIDAPIAWDGV